MKKSLSPGSRLKPSEWGKLLLTASLLLVFVMGSLQLYEVQNFFFPGKYYAIKLNSISKEYFKIQRGLTSLQVQIKQLASLQPQQGQANLVPRDLASAKDATPLQAEEARISPEPTWPSLIHAAKEKRVTVARKLNYIGVVLMSMHRSLEAQSSDSGGASIRKPEIEKTLQQIQEEWGRWRIYHDRLNELSQKLEKLEEQGSSPSTKIVSDIVNK